MRVAMVVGAAALLSGCAAPPDRELRVGMVEYGFLPSRIEIAAGERIRLIVTNAGRIEHDFAVDERGRALGLEHIHLRPGEKATKDWTAPATPTSLRILCTIPGHEQLGMVAALVVEQRLGPSPSASR